MTRSSMARRVDWRVWLGLTLTVIWLFLGVVYIRVTVGWPNFTSLPADRLGNFFEGAFAPLAFLWLVIGYFLQQKELEQNTDALRSQSERMAAQEVYARQETFLRIAATVRSQLGLTIGLLYISSQGAAGDGTVSDQEQSRLFSLLSMQDTEVFSRRMIETHLAQQSEEQRFSLFYGTKVRARHSNNLIYTFERLLVRAREVDPDGMFQEALHASGHGIVYRIAKRHQARAPEELADRNRTGTYIEF